MCNCDCLQQAQGMQGTDTAELIRIASKARSASYCPYSNFAVGAAILTGSGKIYSGSNVENASFGLTICAERSAAIKAVNDGETKFKVVACVGG